MLRFIFICVVLMASPLNAQGNVASTEFMAGMALEYRADEEPDYKNAAAHYQAAAAAGSREALLALARIYGPGQPLWAGPEFWRDQLVAASQGGWPEAAFQLASALEQKMVSADGLNPPTLYLQAAAAGYGPAALRLGELYKDGLQGLPQDDKMAALWLCVAAENHEASAALLLGQMYYDRNTAVSIKWLERVDTPEANYLLGELYLKEKRFFEAIGVFSASADQDYPQAHLALGLLNLDNDFGRRPNPREGLKHLKVAAQAGLPEGSYQLAKMYLNGLATPKDPITGTFWLHKAAEKGHETAREEYDKIVYNFTIGQKKRLERMIEDDSATPITTVKTPAQTKGE